MKNYGDFNTYQKDLKDIEDQKREKDILKQKEVEARRIQGLKSEQDLRSKMLEESSRRFGDKSEQSKRLEGETEDKYREII